MFLVKKICLLILNPATASEVKDNLYSQDVVTYEPIVIQKTDFLNWNFFSDQTFLR